MRLDAFGALLAALTFLGAIVTTDRPSGPTGGLPPTCRPVDSAWAVVVRVTDAATGRPVTDAAVRTTDWSRQRVTDSSGWVCLRTITHPSDTIYAYRTGYREDSLVVTGRPGITLTREMQLQRVTRPCCDLRGRWTITLALDSAGRLGPRPTARSVTGPVDLGSKYLPAQDGDDLDSLVRVVRGLHHVDFKPFFGGPVARDVSTTIFGGGPDLFHEVMATVPDGDSVDVVFIPRMSHGSLWIHGRIRADTIRGLWIQNAYCCGATGHFTMVRIGSADSSASSREPDPLSAWSRRRSAAGPPPASVPPGEAPTSRWRPQLAVASNGALWLATGGLFVADSLGGRWLRVLGGDADPVEADELLMGLHMAFSGSRTAVIGMSHRRNASGAPVVYRTDDRGESWAAVPLAGVSGVDAMSGIAADIWLVPAEHGEPARLFRSKDAGRTWTGPIPTPGIRNVNLLHRTSVSAGLLATSGDSRVRVLWRTTDGGGHWSPLPTPSEQGLQRLPSYASRVEEIATVGGWMIVREHGRVFASRADTVRWRPLKGVEHVASEFGGNRVFVLTDSLHPAFLDSNLRTIWKGDRALPVSSPRNVEQVVMRDGVGYVSESSSAIHEIRNGVARVVRPKGPAN